MDPRSVVLTAFAAMLLSSPAAAQLPILGPEPRAAVWAEATYPSFDGSGLTAFLLNAGARFRIGANSAIFAELPLAWTSEDGPFPDDGLLLGNPLAGIQVFQASPTATFTLHLGARLPLVGADAPAMSAAAGILADFDRAEAYVPETWSAQGGVEWTYHPEGGLLVGFGAGPSGLFPKDDDAELFVNYRAGVGVAAAQIRLMAWFSGRWLATSDGADLADATSHQLTLTGSLTRGNIRPSMFLRVPLDDDLDILKFALGAGLVIGL